MNAMKIHGRLAAMVLVVCAALLGGCAQNQPQQRETQAAGSTESQQAARREMLMTYMSHAVQRDDVIQSVSGLQPGTPNFVALKKSMGSIFTDDVVLQWMVEQFDQGVPKELFMGGVTSRMFSGVNRLGDAEAMHILDPMGAVFSRMDAQQCKAFNGPAKTEGAGKDAAGRDKGFGMLVGAMTPAEIQQFFEGVRLSLRADLQAKPLRPVPTKQQTLDMLKALDKVGGVAGGKGADDCQQVGRLVNAINALPGDQRSAAITFVLTMMGMGAKRTAVA